MDGLTAKYLHVLGAIVLFGTGLGTAFQMWRANKTGNPGTIAAVAKNVVLADWVFTTPAVVLQPVTGIYLAYLGGWGWETKWLQASAALFVLAGMCWLPVVWLQMRMAQLAETAAQGAEPLPPRYRRYVTIWFWLGWPAFSAVLVILLLMIDKPEI